MGAFCATFLVLFVYQLGILISESQHYVYAIRRERDRENYANFNFSYAVFLNFYSPVKINRNAWLLKCKTFFMFAFKFIAKSFLVLAFGKLSVFSPSIAVFVVTSAQQIEINSFFSFQLTFLETPKVALSRLLVCFKLRANCSGTAAIDGGASQVRSMS